MRDEDDLGHVEAFDLGEDRLHRARRLAPAKAWNRAETAVAIAALCHPDVGPGSSGRRTFELHQGEALCPRRASKTRTTRELHRDSDISDQVDLGKNFSELCARTGREAAGHDEAGTRTADLRKVEDRVDRLLPRGVDEGAGVDDDKVGALGIRGRDVSVANQRARQQIGSRPSSSDSRAFRSSSWRSLAKRTNQAIYRRGGPINARPAQLSAHRAPPW